MTLKSSLSKLEQPTVGVNGINLVGLTGKIIKRNLWLLVLAAIGFLLNMPVAVALVWSNMASHPYYRNQHLDSLADDVFVMFNIGSAMMIAAGAILAAFVLFKYLHNRRQVDFYHSLPVRREKFYAANLLAGLLIFLLPYLAAHVLALPLLAGSGLLPYIDMADYLLAMAMHIFAYMIMFALATLAMLLSGNLGGSLKILFSVYALCPIISAMLLLLGSTFLTDYADLGSMEMLLLRLSVIERYMVMMFNDSLITVCWQDIVLGALILAGAVLVGLQLYKKRQSECAGATLAFGWQKPLFKYPYVVLAGTLGAVVMYLAGDRSLVWLAFGLLFFTAFAAQTIEIAIARDFRAIKKNLRGVVLSLVLVALVIGAYGMDVCGYEDWQPEADKVEAVIVNPGALEGMDLFNYRLQDGYVDNVDNYYCLNPLYYYYGGNALTIQNPDNVAAMIAILTSEPLGFGEFHQQGSDDYDDYYGYYDYNDTNYSRVCFKMKNGGYKVRYMSYGGIVGNLDAYTALYDSEEIRTRLTGSLEIPENLTVRLDYLEDYTAIYGYDFGPIREQDDAKVRQLWETYRSEFAKLTAKECLTTAPLGCLNLGIYQDYTRVVDDLGEFDENWTDYWYHSVKVYPQMTETIKMLRGFYGSEVLGNQYNKYQLSKIIEYTPKNSQLQMTPNSKRPDDVIIPKETAMADVEVYSTQAVDYMQYADIVAVEDDDYVGKPVDISRAAEIIANTVSEAQLGDVEYYRPWRHTDCLKYYELFYMVEDGATVMQIRYELP